MRVTIGPLARSAFEEQAGGNLPASVRAALLHYLSKLQNGRPPAAYPGFLAEAGSGRASDDSIEVEVELDERVEGELRQAAADQGTDLASLAGHAVLVYLAELDRAEAGGEGSGGA